MYMVGPFECVESTNNTQQSTQTNNAAIITACDRGYNFESQVFQAHVCATFGHESALQYARLVGVPASECHSADLR